MMRVLVPVDGSRRSLRAVRHVVDLVGMRQPLEVLLVNVEEKADAPEVGRFLKPGEIRRFQVKRGEQRLEAARALLEKAGVIYKAHVTIGEVAPTIARLASRTHCDKIIMGTRGMGAVGALLLGSVANKVIHLAKVPVTLVK